MVGSMEGGKGNEQTKEGGKKKEREEVRKPVKSAQKYKIGL